MTTQTYVDLILGRDRTPGEVVLADAERSLTADQLRHEVYAVARILVDLGLGAGSRLGLLTDNECAALTVRYAAHLVGISTVHLPDAGDPFRLATFLRETEVGAVLVTQGRAGHLAAALCADGGRAPVVLSAGHVGAEGLEVRADVLDLARTATGEPVPAAVPDDVPACLVTSGGTTGSPKASLRSMSDWTALVTGREDPRRRQLVCTPIAYVAQVLADQTLVGGGAVVLRPAVVPFDAAGVLAAIESERITHLCLVEPALVELLDHPDLERRDLGSLVALTHIGADAGSRLRTRLLGRVAATGLGDVLVHTYGSSEVGLVSVLAGEDYSTRHPESLSTAGCPLPGVAVTLDGSVAAGRAGEGEIVVGSAGACRATTRFPRVHDDPAYVGPHSRRTGDWGLFDESGRLTVRGRLDDAVDGRDGGLVFPVDVQDALCAVPEVAYAVAIPSRTAGLAATGFAAVVVLRVGSRLTESDLAAITREADPALPLDRVVVVERIPGTEQGKPDRPALSDALLGSGEESVA